MDDELKSYLCNAMGRRVNKEECKKISWNYDETYGYIILADCEGCDWLDEKPREYDSSYGYFTVADCEKCN